MSRSANEVPRERATLSPAIPWMLFVAAGVPYLGSLFLAIVQLGDPPNAGNDWLRRVLLACWLLLFVGAILSARATRHFPTLSRITSFCFVLTVLGLFFVL